MPILVASTSGIQRQIPDPREDRPWTVRCGARLVLAFPLIVCVFLDTGNPPQGASDAIARAPGERRDREKCNKFAAVTSDYRVSSMRWTSQTGAKWANAVVRQDGPLS